MDHRSGKAGAGGRLFGKRMISLVAGILVLSVVIGSFMGWDRGEDQPTILIPVNAWLTTADLQTGLSEQNEGLEFCRDPEAGKEDRTVIYVDESRRYQEVVGFGASITDSSGWLLYNKLTPEVREQTMKELFHPTEGIGLNYLRQPMGASDFALGDYTYDDADPEAGDPGLARFSTEHDDTYIIPALKKALSYNPTLKIMATPWSPPAWMKDSGVLAGGSLKESAYGDYAEYFVKFIKEYEDKGVPIDAVTLQNEPHASLGYPSMLMSSQEQAELIKNYVGPAFQKNGLGAKIFVWDHNFDEPEYARELLEDPELASYVAGSAWHNYAGQPEVMNDILREHPDKAVYFTEGSSGEWVDNQFKYDLMDGIRYFRNGAGTFVRWNLALDENHGPTNNGCTNCTGLVRVNSGDGTVDKLATYYGMGHFSKFVDQGARRIYSSAPADGIWNAAFLNGDGSKVLVVYNESAKTGSFRVQWGEAAFTAKLPPGAAATYVWSGDQPGQTAVPAMGRTFRAAAYDAMYGMRPLDAGDEGSVMMASMDGQMLGFEGLDLGGGADRLKVRWSPGLAAATIEVRLDRPDGDVIGELKLEEGADPTEWHNSPVALTSQKLEGLHSLYFVLRGVGGMARISWVKLE